MDYLFLESNFLLSGHNSLASVSECPRDIKKTTLRDSLLQPDCQGYKLMILA